MPHYRTVKEEREAIEQFQIMTETMMKPAIEALKESSTQREFDRLRDELRDGTLIRDWYTMLNTFRVAHDDENTFAAADIAKEVDDSMREANARRKMFAVSAAPSAGKRRKYSRKYCKKTRCRKMGFTQKASCRPYKNCFTRRVRRSGY